MKVTDPIGYLEGDWTYERSLSDRPSEIEGRAEGTAVFVPDGDGLRWTETGRVEIGEARTTAHRELQIVPDDEAGSGWMVLFEDGRPFHPLVLDRESHGVVHPCVDDLYHGYFRVESESSFSTTWRVRGPNKDQLIETVYRRIDASTPD